MATLQCKTTVFSDIQAILFDKDGTLADSATYLRNLAYRRSRLIDAQIPGVQEPLLMAFGVEGQRMDPVGLMAVGTRYENEIAAAAYIAETGRGWHEAVKIAQSCFQDAERSLPPKAEQTPPIEGAIALLTTLHEAGLALGIVSADSTAQVQAFVQHYQLNSLFSVQLGSDGAIAKPNPTLVFQACEQLQVSPKQTLVIGDAQTDIDMAIAAGVAGWICVTWGGFRPQALTAQAALLDRWSDLHLLQDLLITDS